MKILLVSNAFYPEISPRSYRATELAKEFTCQGHEVTVITRFRKHDYSGFLQDRNIILKMWDGGHLPSVRIAKHKPCSLVSRGLKRALLLLLEYPAIEDMFHVRRMLKMEQGYDLMISFAVPYPVHWGTAWARTKKWQISQVWIADCGDPYMGDILDSFRKPFYFKYLEKWFCRKADFISIPVITAITAYYAEFHDKIRIIPQGFSFDREKLVRNLSPKEAPEFAYAGSFLQGIRDPKPLLEYLSVTSLPYRFHVFTDQTEYLCGFKEKLGENLVMSGYIPRDELLERLSQMDFLINFDNNTTLNIPSKLIDYSLTGRPVLNIRREFSDVELTAFLRGDYSARMRLPDPEQYHISNIAGQFTKLRTLEC